MAQLVSKPNICIYIGMGAGFHANLQKGIKKLGFAYLIRDWLIMQKCINSIKSPTSSFLNGNVTSDARMKPLKLNEPP